MFNHHYPPFRTFPISKYIRSRKISIYDETYNIFYKETIKYSMRHEQHIFAKSTSSYVKYQDVRFSGTCDSQIVRAWAIQAVVINTRK